MAQLRIQTPSGPARVDLDVVAGSTQLVVIGHGAGGTVDAPDLLAVRDRCVAAGISVARVTQPYRLAGKKAPPTSMALDAAWAAVIEALGRRAALRHLRFVYAGRSAGARVACRAASDEAVKPRPIAVLALAFPVHPPGKPEKSRGAELAAVPVPTLVVQGDRDPFGMPEPGDHRSVVTVPGDHSLKKAAALVGEVVVDWLANVDTPAPTRQVSRPVAT